MMDKKTKYIVLDATPAIHGLRAIRRYAFYLIEELAKQETDISFNLLYLSVNKKNMHFPNLEKENFSEIYSYFPGKLLSILWNTFNAPKISYWAKEAGDFVHFLGGHPYIPNNSARVLTTLHGFASRYIPEFIDNTIVDRMNKQLEFTVKNSTDFITVSETNRQEAINLWGIPEQNIHSIPLGISPEFRIYDLKAEEKCVIRKRYELPDKPFLLFVGALEPHKNIKTIIQSYHLLPSQLQEKYQLVLIGKETHYCEEYKELILSFALADKVSFIDYIQPGSIDLAYLYNLAELFVFPSYYEGWASPPLEAMKCGTPVIVSDIPSLRESTGNHATYLDPQDSESLAMTIQEILENKNLYQKLQQQGFEFSKQYTWQRCAKKTLALYEKILE